MKPYSLRPFFIIFDTNITSNKIIIKDRFDERKTFVD